MSLRSAAILLAISLASSVPAATARAQLLGIGAFLNPEGSRLFPQLYVFPRHSGKPDLRWRSFDWQYTDVSAVGRTQYHLYFYPEESWTARYAIPRINDQVHELSGVFGYEPSQEFVYVLFSSQHDFQQANIFDISEGVEGITSTTEATMAIPYWGEAETFRHISTHEMVHQFQVQKANDVSGNGVQGGFSSAPLWFVEGMAEYYSLHGLDPESRVYLRDLSVYPKPEKDYKLTQFLEDGEPNFINIYKIGQAKIAFLETFGKGATQRVLEMTAKDSRRDLDSFGNSVARVTGLKADEIDKQWKDWSAKEFGSEAAQLSQSLDQYDEVTEAGENLDSYAVSPSGDLIAIREIDAISGVTSLKVIDLKDHGRKAEVDHDRTSSVITFYFMQRPILALTDHLIAYAAETVSGPRIVVRALSRRPGGQLQVGAENSVPAYQHHMGQAQALTFSPDETALAFVGVNSRGSQNIYTLPLAGGIPQESGLRQITDGFYSWRDLKWSKDGILAASDQTEDAKYNIFLVDPSNGRSRRLTHAKADELAPDGDAHSFVYQSLESGTPQIHRFTPDDTLIGHEVQLTQAKTEMIAPEQRGDTLYGLGFRAGRFHLYRVPARRQLGHAVPEEPANTLAQAWIPTLVDLPPSRVHSYKAFFSSGIRIDYIAAFLGTGAFGGLSLAASDLMRNYSIQADLASLGGLQYTQADAFFSSDIGRTKWTLGAYRVVLPAVDNVFPPADGTIRTYLRREAGGLGALEYPLGPFNFIDTELRIGGVDRTDFSDPALADPWSALNPGQEFLLGPMLRYGYDTILHELFTGPLRGTSLLLELDGDYFPQRSTLTPRARIDFNRYWQLRGTSVLVFQAMYGASWGDPFNSPFVVSSDDILRAYPIFDTRLYGNYFLATNAELHLPVGTLFRFPPLRGMLAYDLGSVYLTPQKLGSSIASAYSFGLTFNVPPLSLNFILSFPIRVAPGPQDSSVFHFTLRYLYY